MQRLIIGVLAMALAAAGMNVVHYAFAGSGSIGGGDPEPNTITLTATESSVYTCQPTTMKATLTVNGSLAGGATVSFYQTTTQPLNPPATQPTTQVTVKLADVLTGTVAPDLGVANYTFSSSEPGSYDIKAEYGDVSDTKTVNVKERKLELSATRPFVAAGKPVDVKVQITPPGFNGEVAIWAASTQPAAQGAPDQYGPYSKVATTTPASSQPTIPVSLGAGKYRLQARASCHSDSAPVEMVAIEASLVSDVASVPYYSSCGQPGEPYGAEITVATNPAGYENKVSVQVKSIDREDAYPRTGKGGVYKTSSTQYSYAPPVEGSTCPPGETKTATIVATVEGDECGTAEVSVKTPFQYMTQFPFITKTAGTVGAGAQYRAVYDYLRCRYPNLGLGFFPNVAFVDTGVVPNCGANAAGVGGVDADACTEIATGNVTFGINAFLGGSEANAVSTIAHELKHTPEGGGASECAAYTWEVDNASTTCLDGQELLDVKDRQRAACGN